MKATSLPTYAMLVISGVILANIIAAWIILLTIGKNKGELYDQGPPWMVAASVITLLFCWYDIFMPAEVAFWGSVVLAVFALWGAWADYSYLLEHYRKQSSEKSRRPSGG
jgi:uncharacterized membrane protein HdeD (DUF308 family)